MALFNRDFSFKLTLQYFAVSVISSEVVMWEDLMKLRALIRDALLLEWVQLLLSCNLLQNAVSIVVTTLES